MLNFVQGSYTVLVFNGRMNRLRIPLCGFHFQTYFIASGHQLSFIAIGRSLKERDKTKGFHVNIHVARQPDPIGTLAATYGFSIMGKGRFHLEQYNVLVPRAVLEPEQVFVLAIPKVFEKEYRFL